MIDYILNGQGHGPVAQQLLNNANGAVFDTGPMRPFIGKDGRHYVTVNQFDPRTGEMKTRAIPLTNAAATLRKDEWIRMDTAVVDAAKAPLRAWADLRAANSVTIPNGMGTTVLQYQTRLSQATATISMDGDRDGERDRPLHDLKNLPLPIIHSDFWYSWREISTSRQSGTPLDVSGAEDASRAVAEEAEKLTVGTGSSYSYGGGTIYGYINFPQRNTKTITLPTDPGWSPKTLIGELLAMKKQARDDRFGGPYGLYFSPGWDLFLDDDYSDVSPGTGTLRQRIGAIDQFSWMRTLEYLTDYQIVMVQMAPQTARAVIGMDVTTLQWEERGGHRQHFKVMAILVPQIRSDASGQCGIVHAVAA